MNHTLARRKPAHLDKILHMSLVRLTDDLYTIIHGKESLSVGDLNQLANLIKAVIAIQKLMPKPKKAKQKPADVKEELFE